MFKLFNRSGSGNEPSGEPESGEPPVNEAVSAPEDMPQSVFAAAEAPASPEDATPVEVVPAASNPEAAFDLEFGASPPSEDASPVAEPPLANSWEEGALEEWTEPLETTPLDALEPETVLSSPLGPLRILQLLSTTRGQNCYLVEVEGADLGPLRLREGGGPAATRLLHEEQLRRELDGTGRFAMLPSALVSFEEGDRLYFAEEAPASVSTLAQRLQEGVSDEASLSEILLTLVQVAAFLVRLHAAGHAHLSLRPEIILPGKPVQIADVSFASPLGSQLGEALSFPGYSPPELVHPGAVEPRADIYAVGAMLYRAVTGEVVPETGVDFTVWQPKLIVAGVPQILRRCLGAPATRYSAAEDLHRDLVRLKNRLRPQTVLNVTGASTIGLEPSRSTNQDAYGYLSGAWESDTGPTAWAAFCVADGMGGMAAGEVASEVAVQTFLGAAAAWASTRQGAVSAADQAAAVKSWAEAANEAVVKALDARGARGGCTLDAGLVLDRRLATAHIGDSRLYLLRGETAELLSRDHSYVMSLLMQGEITLEDIRTHPDRNKVTRSLGERHPLPEYFTDTLAVQTNAPTMELQTGDVLLACSDGLWEPVLESEMTAALAEDANLNGAARRMLQIALQRGAPDNATVVLLRVEEWGAVFG